MAGRKKDGGEPLDITVRILQDIREELRSLNGRMDQLTGRVDGLNERVDGLNQRVDGLTGQVETLTRQTEKGFKDLNGRFNHLLEFAGGLYRDHERRIRSLERISAKVGRAKSR